MYKYYDVLDNKNEVILHDDRLVNYLDVEYKLPIEFFHKNKQLFDELKHIFTTYGFVTDESIFERLEGKANKEYIYDVIYDHSLINYRRPYDDFDGNYLFVDDFYRISNPSNYVCENYLNDMLSIIRILKKVYPNNTVYYEVLKNEINKVLKELVDNNKIVLSDEKIKIVIPNAWYITRSGTLYNSMGKDGHKESNLVYPVTDIKNHSIYPDFYPNIIDSYEERYEEIKERGYITRSEYIHYLNWYGKCDTFYEDRIYHKVIIELVLGIIKAHLELYSAFDKVKETDDYISSIDKIFELSHNQIDDLLIKFVGMSKVKAGGFPFICTSNTSVRDFEEYTDRGYQIDLVNPIVVQDGEVKEVDLSDHRKILKALGR